MALFKAKTNEATQVTCDVWKIYDYNGVSGNMRPNTPVTVFLGGYVNNQATEPVDRMRFTFTAQELGIARNTKINELETAAENKIKETVPFFADATANRQTP